MVLTLFGKVSRTRRARAVAWTIIVSLIALLGATGHAFAVACSVGSFTGAYGSVNVLSGAAASTTASFTVTCSGGSANQGLRLCLNMGPGTTATGPSSERVLRSASAYINHEFYFDAAHTQLWGSWGIGSSSAYPPGSPAGIQKDVTLNSSGSGTFTYTVHASILASQQSTTPGSTAASRRFSSRYNQVRAPVQPAAPRALRVQVLPRP
jgi:spore coat protein U-like protein